MQQQKQQQQQEIHDIDNRVEKKVKTKQRQIENLNVQSKENGKTNEPKKKKKM